MIVEPAAAALAAARRSSPTSPGWAHALEEMGRHGLATEAGRAADQAFHNTILEAARNGPLIALSSSIAAAVTWTTIFKHRRQVPAARPDARITALLYEAIVAGDPDGRPRDS